MVKNNLSIIIINYNVKNLLNDCINSLYESLKGIRFEIIVIDNASTDDSVEMLYMHHPQIKTIVNTQNIGFGAANNQGLAEASGDFILLLNPDTIIFPDTIAKTLKFCQEHPEVGIVGCKILNPDKTLQPSCNYFPNLLDYIWETFFVDKLFPRNKLIGRFHMSYFNHDVIAEVDCVKGAFMMVKKQVIAEIKGFDEDFFIYSEEMDLCYRAKQKGWKIFFYPDAEIIHYGGQSTFPESEAMFIEFHKGRYKFFRKHKGLFKAKIVKLMLFGGVAIRAFIWFLVKNICRNNVFYGKRYKIFYKTLIWYLKLEK